MVLGFPANISHGFLVGIEEIGIAMLMHTIYHGYNHMTILFIPHKMLKDLYARLDAVQQDTERK